MFLDDMGKCLLQSEKVEFHVEYGHSFMSGGFGGPSVYISSQKMQVRAPWRKVFLKCDC